MMVGLRKKVAARVPSGLKDTSVGQVKDAFGVAHGVIENRLYKRVTMLFEAAGVADGDKRRSVEDIVSADPTVSVVATIFVRDRLPVVAVSARGLDKVERRDLSELVTSRAAKVGRELADVEAVIVADGDVRVLNREQVCHWAQLWFGVRGSVSWPPAPLADQHVSFVQTQHDVVSVFEVAVDMDSGMVDTLVSFVSSLEGVSVTVLHRPVEVGDSRGRDSALVTCRAASFEDLGVVEDEVFAAAGPLLRLYLHRVLGRQSIALAAAAGLGVFPWQHAALEVYPD